MTRLSIVAAAAGASVALFGCGNAPMPSPPPYMAEDVATAWNNHFAAFGHQDLDQIVLDYNADSVLQIFNDACDANNGGVLSEFVGPDAIRGFFADLFTTLGDMPGLDLPMFTGMTMNYTNPTVEDGMMMGEMMSYDAANVFLVWSSVDEGILKGTDTFLWDKTDSMGVQVRKQNIVVTEPQACPEMPMENPAAPEVDPNNKVAMGWSNHLTTFGDQDRAGILEDYTETSVVQIWSWGGADEAGYSTYTGIAEIGDMFDALWASMNAQTDSDGSIGLVIPQGFPRVEVDKQSVFLTWHSYSNPKATDTFLFDSEGKILRQTIVTTTGTAPMSSKKIVV